MPDFITLTCPNCGGKLTVVDDMQTLACSFCGNEHYVYRGEGVISLLPIEKKIEELKTSVSTSKEEISKINKIKEINQLEEELEKWDKKDTRLGIRNDIMTYLFGVCIVIGLVYAFIVREFWVLLIVIPVIIILVILKKGSERETAEVKEKMADIKKKLVELDPVHHQES